MTFFVVVKIIWTKFSKSKKTLGQELTETLIEIIREHDHIEFEINQ
jgi:hypothetical protein